MKVPFFPSILNLTFLEVAIQKEIEQKRDPMVTVERLLKCQEETKNRLSGLRKQLIHEENQTL